jgi:hypothetical protein
MLFVPLGELASEDRLSRLGRDGITLRAKLGLR